MKQETNTPVQPIFKIDGKNMVLMTLTPSSGQYKFMDVSDGEIYLFEKYEIPKHYLAELPPLPHSTPVQPTTVGELPEGFSKGEWGMEKKHINESPETTWFTQAVVTTDEQRVALVYGDTEKEAEANRK